jgi:hypothetical protein
MGAIPDLVRQRAEQRDEETEQRVINENNAYADAQQQAPDWAAPLFPVRFVYNSGA